MGRALGPAVTARLSVTFKSPLLVDEEVEVVGRLLARRSRAGVAEAHMRVVEGGRLIAEGRSEFILRRGTWTDKELTKELSE